MDSGTLQILVNQAPTAALALVFLWMLIAGKIHTDPEFRRLAADLDTERAAHEQTRAAYALATARADAGVRAAELVAAAVEGARHAQPPQIPYGTPPAQ